jgi:hypothetical protein
VYARGTFEVHLSTHGGELNFAAIKHATCHPAVATVRQTSGYHTWHWPSRKFQIALTLRRLLLLLLLLLIARGSSSGGTDEATSGVGTCPHLDAAVATVSPRITLQVQPSDAALNSKK